MNEQEKAKTQIDSIIKFIQECYEAFVDHCGEDDEINTLPTKEVLGQAKELQAWIEKVTK